MLAEKNPTIQKAKNVLDVISKDDITRMAYEAREKQIHDEATRIEEATAKGIAEGIEKGIEEGMERGMEKAKYLMVKDLLRFKVDKKIIVESSGLTESQIEEIERTIR